MRETGVATERLGVITSASERRQGGGWRRPGPSAEEGNVSEGVGALEPVSLQGSSGPALVSPLFSVFDGKKPVGGAVSEQTWNRLESTAAGPSVSQSPRS